MKPIFKSVFGLTHLRTYALTHLSTCSLTHSILALVFFYPLSAVTQPLSGLNLEGLREKKGSELRWQDNPFVQPVEPLDVQDLHLTAIVYGEGEVACLINGEVLRVGNKIGFSEVVHIEKAHVVLRNENGIFSLSLKGAARQPASVAVEPATGEK